ncbi:hypothetical protein ABFS82_08G079700 [Erythranthe guttata]
MTDRENVALPKFGSWDVNNPAAAGKYSMIFDRAMNEKRSNGQRDSPRSSNDNMSVTKHEDHSSRKPSTSRRWLCCSNLKYAES